ncbi:MAG: DUF4124 domain-containing protein [Granulosicoccaceae bacterium]
MSAKPRLSLAIVVLGLLIAFGPAEARTYKWVDENGVTQYTQTPPPKGDYEQVRTTGKPVADTPRATRDLEIRLDQFEQRREEAARQRAEKNKAHQEIAQRRADCEKAKQNLEYFQSHPRIRYKDKDGNISYLAEEDRQNKMQAIRDNIKKLCK